MRRFFLRLNNQSIRLLGCPHEGMCIPFGKEWAVRGGEVIRCVGNKKKFYLEAVKGGNDFLGYFV